MTENKVIYKLSEILADLDSLEKQYRNEYYSAVDIENLDTAKQVQDAAFEKIRSVKSWKIDVETLTLSISKNIGTPSPMIAQPESAFINETLNEESNDSKVGTYVREKMRSLCDYKFSDSEIESITDENWSKRVLGINYPFCKIFDDSRSIFTQIKNIYGKDRYYQEVFSFRDMKLLVTSQWFERNRAEFDTWYNSLIRITDTPFEQKTNEQSPEILEKKSNYTTHGYTKKDPIRITMFGKTYSVKFWNEVLIKVCEIMLLKKPYIVAKFDKEETLNSEQRTNFSYNESGIKFNKKKLSNGLWIETNRSANDIVFVSKKILKLCGYDENELSIDVEQSENELSTEESFWVIDKIENSDKQIETNGDIQQSKEYSRFIFKDKKQIELIEKTFLEYIKKEGSYKQSRMKLYMYFIMAINLGLRVSDMLSLRFSNLINDMDLENGIINFKDEIGVDIQNGISEKKTANSRSNRPDRHVTINDTVKKVVILYLSAFKDTKIENFLFPNQSTNSDDEHKPMSVNAIDDALKKLDKRSGLNLGLNSNSLRRTFGYWHYINSGYNYEVLFELQELFGHTSIPVTLKYIGITNEMVANAYKT